MLKKKTYEGRAAFQCTYSFQFILRNDTYFIHETEQSDQLNKQGKVL